LGFGGPGGYGASGTTQQWLDTVAHRGQGQTRGPSATDFGPWGGSITFNSASNWHFGIENGPSGSTNDFLTVALHELAHLLGFGTSDSWFNLVNDLQNTFTGSKSSALAGGPSPLSFDKGHWEEGTVSTNVRTGATQETAMDPTILQGTRKGFTAMDLAALDDIGWTIKSIPISGPGDINGDGKVNLVDFQILKANFGTGTTPAQGDLNSDGKVNLVDFGILKANFGKDASTNVPEPSAALLLLTTVAAALLKVRARRE
jgi:hypothetical protein